MEFSNREDKIMATVNRNWVEIKRVMELSQKTDYSWLEYSQKITNGLSNNALTKRGCGDVIWFVERLNKYANMSNEYLMYAKKMSAEQIDFINKNKDFLKNIR